MDEVAASVGLRINTDKTTIMKLKTVSLQTVRHANGPIVNCHNRYIRETSITTKKIHQNETTTECLP